jgi:hypothetical protein
MPRLSHAHKTVLAKRYLGGETQAELVGFAGLDARQIKNLFASKSMKAVIAEEQARLDEIVAQKRMRMSLDLERSVDRLKARERGTGESQLAAKAAAFEIGKLLPLVRRSE